MDSTGQRFRTLAAQGSPLLLAGTINALCALLAQQAGFKAIYLSGAGVANADLGLPDLGLTSLDDVVAATRKITQAVQIPLLVDADTGWGTTVNVRQTVKQISAAGAAGLHLEDQAFPKRCGHRTGKVLVSVATMQDRIKAAVDARADASFVIMARTDAASVDGTDAAIGRALDYVKAGADMIFAETITTLADYKKFTQVLDSIPVLANITEFGLTPLFTAQELAQQGVKIALYPLSAFRAMNHAAQQVYTTILQQGTQQACIAQMQTRAELYTLLNYYTYEQEIDNSREPNV